VIDLLRYFVLNKNLLMGESANGYVLAGQVRMPVIIAKEILIPLLSRVVKLLRIYWGHLYNQDRIAAFE
jgi:hypothetical protein